MDIEVRNNDMIFSSDAKDFTIKYVPPSTSESFEYYGTNMIKLDTTVPYYNLMTIDKENSIEFSRPMVEAIERVVPACRVEINSVEAPVLIAVAAAFIVGNVVGSIVRWKNEWNK